MSRRRWHPAVVFPGERPQRWVPPAIPADPLAGLSAEQRARLPNLVGIGAAKCGTSALHAYLADHPEIATPRAKELEHFGGRRWLEDLPAYASRFPPGAVRCETSPSYTIDPVIPCVPEQMAAVLPEPRFVYVVGEPVRRVVAHWNEHRALAFERRSLAEALEDAEDPYNPYVAASRYGHQLARYLEVFGPDRVLVVDQEDLRARRRETLRQVFGFAGVDPDHASPVQESEPNAASRKTEPTALGRRLIDRGWLPPRLHAAAPHLRLVARPLREPAIDERTRTRLEAILRPDIERFRALTGRPFATWSV